MIATVLDIPPRLVGWPAYCTVVALGLFGLAMLLRHRAAVGQTTLRAPWLWAMAALVGVTAIEMTLAFLISDREPAWASHLRYIAGVLSFSPVVALLGAKRPQDVAWQAIVLSLLAILAAPACWAALYRPDAPLELDSAWEWFVLVMILMGAINGLPTGQWLTSALLTSGQVLMLTPHLPGMSRDWVPGQSLWALVLGVLAVAAWSWRFPPRHSREEPLDRLWLDFRDSFGTLWAMRVAERFNRAAASYGWPERLVWTGLVRLEATADGDPPSANADETKMTTIRMLLRRFVSDAWIAERDAAGQRATVSS